MQNVIFILLQVWAFAAMAHDKFKAIRGHWRTSEGPDHNHNPPHPHPNPHSNPNPNPKPILHFNSSPPYGGMFGPLRILFGDGLVSAQDTQASLPRRVSCQLSAPILVGSLLCNGEEISQGCVWVRFRVRFRVRFGVRFRVRVMVRSRVRVRVRVENIMIVKPIFVSN